METATKVETKPEGVIPQLLFDLDEAVNRTRGQANRYEGTLQRFDPEPQHEEQILKGEDEPHGCISKLRFILSRLQSTNELLKTNNERLDKLVG